MEKSKSIAGIVGPTLIVVVFSEMRLWNPTIYDTQTVPLIYLNGILLFVAGLAIVKSHNIWIYGWQTLAENPAVLTSLSHEEICLNRRGVNGSLIAFFPISHHFITSCKDIQCS